MPEYTTDDAADALVWHARGSALIDLAALPRCATAIGCCDETKYPGGGPGGARGGGGGHGGALAPNLDPPRLHVGPMGPQVLLG